MKNKFIISGAPDLWIPSHLSYGQYLIDELTLGDNNIALINGKTGITWTYKTLLQTAVNVASGMRRIGAKRGDIVGVCSENRMEYTATLIGAILNGVTIATASPDHTSYEMKHVLNLSRPKFIFCSSKALKSHSAMFKKTSAEIIVFDNDLLDKTVKRFEEFAGQHTEIESFVPTDVDGTEDVVAILCSSGTTGLPKGVMLTHLFFLISAVDFHEQHKSTDIQTLLTFVPWHHTYGFTSTLYALTARKTVVYLPRFEEQLFFRSIQDYKVNFILAVPTVVVVMAKSTYLDKYDMTSVRKLVSGSAPLSSETLLTVKRRIPTLTDITQAYGMTETGCVMRDKTRDESNAGSAGKLVNGVRAKVVDLETGKRQGPNRKGEICLKSSLIMKGYIGDDRATKMNFDEDGFFKTGDVGYYTEDGLFYILDRVKELIKYKGNQVPPAEVEGVLMQSEGVKECAVVGKPDELAGELPTAFVVRAQGSGISEQELKDLVACKLSNPKKLRGGVHFVNELPRNPSGKVLRRLLKEKYFGKPASKL